MSRYKLSLFTVFITEDPEDTVLDEKRSTRIVFAVMDWSKRNCVCLFLKDGPRPNQKEMFSLRAFLLMFIKQLVMKVSSHFLSYSMCLL